MYGTDFIMFVCQNCCVSGYLWRVIKHNCEVHNTLRQGLQHCRGIREPFQNHRFPREFCSVSWCVHSRLHAQPLMMDKPGPATTGTGFVQVPDRLHFDTSPVLQVFWYICFVCTCCCSVDGTHQVLGATTWLSTVPCRYWFYPEQCAATVFLPQLQEISLQACTTQSDRFATFRSFVSFLSCYLSILLIPIEYSKYSLNGISVFHLSHNKCIGMQTCVT